MQGSSLCFHCFVPSCCHYESYCYHLSTHWSYHTISMMLLLYWTVLGAWYMSRALKCMRKSRSENVSVLSIPSLCLFEAIVGNPWFQTKFPCILCDGKKKNAGKPGSGQAQEIGTLNHYTRSYRSLQKPLKSTTAAKLLQKYPQNIRYDIDRFTTKLTKSIHMISSSENHVGPEATKPTWEHHPFLDDQFLTKLLQFNAELIKPAKTFTQPHHLKITLLLSNKPTKHKQTNQDPTKIQPTKPPTNWRRSKQPNNQKNHF